MAIFGNFVSGGFDRSVTSQQHLTNGNLMREQQYRDVAKGGRIMVETIYLVTAAEISAC